MRLITFANRKGGCGKTTSVVNVAHGLVLEGHKVLLVDVDPQAHASITLGIRLANDGSPRLTHLLSSEITAPEVICDTKIPGLSLLPSSRELGHFEMEFNGLPGSELILAEKLSGHLHDFDYVIFDPSPTLSLLMISTLIAAREVYIPMQLHFLAMEGLAEMMQIIYKLNASHNPDLRLHGIIPTFYNKKTKVARNIAAEICDTFGPDKLLPGIRNNIALAEAPSYCKTIFQHAPRSIGANDYKKLSQAIEGNKK